MIPVPLDVAQLCDRVVAAGLHALRLLPAALLSPFLGGPLAPAIARITLAAALGACAWQGAGGAPFGGDPLLAAARELALGTALGWLAALPLEAARAGGRLVDTLRGATLCELHVAPLRQRESATGDLLAQALVVLGATSGGARLVIAALLEGFRAIPVGAPLDRAAVLGLGLHGAAELLACAVALGAPAAAGVLAADLVVGLATRAAPGLGVTSAAQPARAALGLLTVSVSTAALAGRLTSAVALSAGLLGGIAGGTPP